MYTRRSFLSKFILGTLGIVSGLALTKPKAQAATLSEATVGYSLPQIQYSEWKDGQTKIYNFYKGPDYTTLEDAYDEIQKIINGDYPNTYVGNGMVILQSISLGGFSRKGLDK